jgi:glutamate-1-semialdehyde 2,1-aminomutase
MTGDRRIRAAVVAGGTSTGSKRPEVLFGASNGVPRRVTRADGCRVWDEAGREYLDTTMALGAVALGYAFPAVTEAVELAARAGGIGPLPPAVEEEVAELLTAVLPGAEAVRFLKTGAEAVAAAVRLARVYTGRDVILTCGYHGWLDWCQDGAGVPAAVRALHRAVPFADIVALDAALSATDRPAAIVVEPVIERAPAVEWLAALRDRATAIGAVLVFDEIKTGFRVARGGAAERWGVVPDLTVVGKALGNGYPIAAVCGRRDLLDGVGRTWISSTLATESVSLAAARAVLGTYRDRDVIGHLEAVGSRLLEGLEQMHRRHPMVIAGVKGIAPMCYLRYGSEELSGRTARAAAARGLIFKRDAYNYVSLAHDLATVDRVLEILESAVAQVERTC